MIRLVAAAGSWLNWASDDHNLSTTTVTFGPSTGGGANGSGNGVCHKLWQSVAFIYCIPGATNGRKRSSASGE